MKRRMTAAVLSLSLLLSGCGILERTYSSVEMHTEAYWENTEEDMLRAESYQDLVNALLLLVGKHAADGVVRVYGLEQSEWEGMASKACSEVQQTDVGSYLLRYMTYQTGEEKDCYVMRPRFSYRRSAEEYAALVSAANEDAVPALLREAVEKGANALTVRLAYFPENEVAFRSMVEDVRREVGAEAQWTVLFHPGLEDGGIVEIVLI